MDSSMNNWFGDANSYVGDIDLKPEVAHTISVTAGLHDAGKSEWNIRLTPYYTYVVNYIGASKAGDFSSNNSQFPLLKIANHDAMIYGADISGNTGLWNSPNYGRFDLTGVIGWVHGETVNTGRSLYHMMPINAKSAVLHKLGGWSNAIELELVAAKTETDTIRNEPKTPGYALINLKSGYEWENIQVNLGIDNLLDRRYYHPKGGVDYADWSNNAQKGQVGPLPAPGRSFNAGVTVKF
jgi:iron complex outermembrane receptor protein